MRKINWNNTYLILLLLRLLGPCSGHGHTISFLQNSLFLATSFQLRVWSLFTESLQQYSAIFLWAFLRAFFLWNIHPLLWGGGGIRESFILTSWAAHCNLRHKKCLSATSACSLYVYSLSNSPHPLGLRTHQYSPEGIQTTPTGIQILVRLQPVVSLAEKKSTYKTVQKPNSRSLAYNMAFKWLGLSSSWDVLWFS